MVTKLWSYLGTDNGLVPDGTKPLPEPVLTYQFDDIQLRAIL